MIKKILAVFATFLMIGTIFSSMVYADDTPPSLPTSFHRKSSSTEITSLEVWHDETIILDEDLIIANGGHLILGNADLIMNCTYDNELVIRVERWGKLHIKNQDHGFYEYSAGGEGGSSSISSYNPDWRYRFEVYGELLIDRSTITNIGGNVPDGGIQIYTAPWGKVELSDSLISQSSSSGIYCYNSTPSITGCTIKSHDGDGIYCDGGKGYDDDLESLSMELFFKQGWNFMSLPVLPDDTALDVLFDELPYYSVYSWDPWGESYKKIEKTDSLEKGRGYMVFVTNDTLLNISGSPIFNYTVDLTKGWNMVGSVIYDTSIATPDDTPDNSVLNWAYTLDALGDFIETQEIQPARGYWVKAKENCTLSLISEKKSPILNGNKIYNNTGDGTVFDSSDSVMNNNEIYSNQGHGINCIESSFSSMDQNRIYSNTGKGLALTSSLFSISNTSIYTNSEEEITMSSNSYLTTLDSRFKKNDVQVNDASELVVNMTCDVRTIDYNDSNVSNTNIVIKNKDGTEVFNGYTDSNGKISSEILTEYTHTSAAMVFQTPHTILVENSSEIINNVDIVMDGPRDITMYLGGDSDLDSYSDDDENKENCYWFEAEHHLYDQNQIIVDYLASKDAATRSSDSVGEIFNETFLPVTSGTYKYYVRARCNSSRDDPMLKLFVHDDASSLISDNQHIISEDYAWYSTPPFSTSGKIQLGASDLADTASIYVDKILLTKINSDLGQITDPLEFDTDSDFIIDGLEVRNTTFWIEAEDYPLDSYAQQYVHDRNASNAQAVKQFSSVGTIHASLFLPADEYRYYVRARSVPGDSGAMELIVNDTSLGTIHLLEKYQWFSKDVTLPSDDTYHFYVNDTSAILPGIYVDKIAIVRLSEVFAGSLADGSSSKTLTFPPAGGYNDTASILVPEDAVITDATMELFGNFSEDQMTTNAFDQCNPDVYGDKVVYQDNRIGDWDIWMYNLTSGAETQITSNTDNQTYPAIYDNYIVWQDGDENVSSPPPIAVLNPSFENGVLGSSPDDWMLVMDPTFFTSLYIDSNAHSGLRSVGFESSPISVPPGEETYWSQSQIPITEGVEYEISTWIDYSQIDSDSDYMANIQVFWYDEFFTLVGDEWSPGINLFTGGWIQETCIATAPLNAVTAEIRLRLVCNDPGTSPYESNLVYFDDVSMVDLSRNKDRSNDCDIYLYDLTTSTEYQITSDPSDQMYPDIYENTIVWQDYRNGDWDIYKYDLSNGLPVVGSAIEQVDVGVQNVDQKYPAIDGNRVVWQDNRWGTWDIFMEVSEFSAEVYDLQEIQITTDLNNQQYPTISGDRVAWQDDRNGDWDIYSYDLSAGYERQITTDSSDQTNPAISGDKVVWEDIRNGDEDIFVYDFSCNREKQLSLNSSDQNHPAIYNDVIVWEDWRNVDADIYGLNQFFTLDIGDNGNVNWNRSEVFLEPDVTLNLADEFNRYLMGHWDEGVSGFIEIPLSFYSNNLGNLTISNISINIEYLMDPLDADTDGDDLGDGREIYNFFGYDIVEAEDAVEIHEWRNPYADLVDLVKGNSFNDFKVFEFEEVNFIHQTGVTLTSSNNHTTSMEGYRGSWIKLRTHIEDTGLYKLKINPVLEEKDDLGFTVGDSVDVAYKYIGENISMPVIVENEGEHIQLNEETAQYLRKVIVNATYVIVEKEGGDVISTNGNSDIKEKAVISEIRYGTSLEGIQTENVSLNAHWDYTAEYNFTRNTNYKILIGLDLDLVPPELRPGGGAVPPDLLWNDISLLRILDVDCIRVERQTLDPLNIDADNDSLLDGFEATDSYYPLNADADGDGLNDYIELYQTNTTLGYRDTDYDGIRDAVEIGWNETKINDNGGETCSPGSWRERIAHWDSPYDYTPINNWDANTTTTTDPFNSDTDDDGIPDGWCDGWTYEFSPINPSSVRTYQKNTNMFKDENYWRYDKTYWKFGGVMDCLVQIWEGEDLNLDGAHETISNWGFDGLTYERLSTSSGETEPDDDDTDNDLLPEGYEVWYSHLEPCVLSDAGTPFPGDDVYFLDPTKDDARLDKDIGIESNELYSQTAGGGWYQLDGAAHFALAQRIQISNPPRKNISKIGVHLNTMNAPKARLEIWSDWGKPFARMASIENYDVNGEGWYVFDVPDSVFRVTNVNGALVPGYFIVMRWVTDEYQWSYLPGGGAPNDDVYLQGSDGNWIKMLGNDMMDHILYEDVFSGDNLTNLEEFIVGTNPKNSNTDRTIALGPSDGLLDGEEVGYRTETGGSITVVNEGFESVFPADGWHINNMGDNPEGISWTQTDIMPFDGMFSAVCVGEDLEHQEEWLITEPIHLEDYDFMELSFYHRADNPFAGNAPNSVLISTTGDDPGDFTQLLEFGPTSLPAAWLSEVITLHAYAGETIRLAWKYEKYPGSPGESWYIDNVVVGGSTTVVSSRGGVIYRTNVAEGALKFDAYGSTGSWINYDGDGQGSIIQGRNFTYDDTVINTTINDPAVSDENILLFKLTDGTTIYLNESYDDIYVWSPDADLRSPHTMYSGGFSSQYYKGTCHIYTYSGLVNMDNYAPILPYRNQELYLSSPFKSDTDGDTIVDGSELDWNKNSERDDSGTLIEADAVINVRDTDSDDDHATDGYEVNWSEDMACDTDPSGLILKNMLDSDSDGDGIKDGDEPLWNHDSDGDGLANMIDQDSDNDGLFDGWDDADGDLQKDGGETAGEDTNTNNLYDEGTEPSPIDYDTDGDGLWDGSNINVTTGYSWLQGEHLGELTAHSFTGQSIGTYQLDWDSDDDSLTDGQEVEGWIIRVRFYDGADELVQVYSDPTDNNSDTDDLLDNIEYRFSNASDDDTDDDGLVDDKEDTDWSGYTSKNETSPVNADTDGDGLLDGNIFNSNYPGEDRDNDAVLDDDEPSPIKRDSDDDGIEDGCEYWSLKNHTTNDGYWDTDSDGLIDLREDDSDNDGLYDGEENYDFNDEINLTTEADPTDWDTDDDGLLDGAEPDWRIDSDYDGRINVRDSNSNNQSLSALADDYDYVYVVFRTDAVDSDDDGYLEYVSGTWIAVDPDGANLISPSSLSLRSYIYVDSVTSITGEYINTCYGPGGIDPIPVETPEEYEVYVKTGVIHTIYIKIGDSYARYFSGGSANTSIHPLPKDAPTPTSPNYIGNHQETHDGRPAINSDSDFDGLSNLIETTFGTDPDDADSDDDGVKDGDELLWNETIDGDSLINALDADSDNDGLFDGTEMGVTDPVPYYNGIIMGTNTKVGNYTADVDPGTFTDPLNPDTDFDGLSDGVEDSSKDGNYDAGIESDPNDKDTDDDGIIDGTEENGFDIPGIGFVTTSAINHDSDGDGIFDGTEAGYTNSMIGSDTNVSRGFFVPDADPATKTNASDDDTDDDGLLDGTEDENKDGMTNINDESDPNDHDSDDDDLTDGMESGLDTPEGSDTDTSSPHWKPDTHPSSTTSPINPDTDGDTIPDGVEDANWNGKKDDGAWNGGAGPGETDPDDSDTDGDTLWDNLEIDGWDVVIYWESNMTTKETRHNVSNPLIQDTDGDTILDNNELSSGSDPTSTDTDGDGIPDIDELIANTSLCGIEANPPWIEKAEIDIRKNYKEILVRTISKIPIIGDIVKWVTKKIPSGLYITCEIDAKDDIGVDSIWVKVDGESAQRQFTDKFRYEFEVDYDTYWLKGWDIDVEAKDVNGNIGKPDIPLHIDGLKDKLYNLLSFGLVLLLQGLGFDVTVLNDLPDTDGDGMSDVLEKACLLNARVVDILWVDLTIAFDWDVTNNIWDLWYLTAYISGMRSASNFLFDGTDGHFLFDTITFYDDVTDGDAKWDTSDIQVFEGLNSEWPHAQGAGHINWGINDDDGHICLPQYFDQWGGGWLTAASPNHADYYKTIVHEFGHYGLHLYDEYQDGDEDSYPLHGGPSSIMNSQHGSSEFTSPIDYDLLWAPPWGYGDTEQHCDSFNQTNRKGDNPNAGESCWESIFRYYFTDPRKDPNAKLGTDYIYFDLERDGCPDYTFPRSYMKSLGPWLNVGTFLEVEDHT